jgi:hypothetical protein
MASAVTAAPRPRRPPPVRPSRRRPSAPVRERPAPLLRPGVGSLERWLALNG